MQLLSVTPTKYGRDSGKTVALLDSREAAKAQRRSILPQPLGVLASSRGKFAEPDLEARWRGMGFAA